MNTPHSLSKLLNFHPPNLKIEPKSLNFHPPSLKIQPLSLKIEANSVNFDPFSLKIHPFSLKIEANSVKIEAPRVKFDFTNFNNSSSNHPIISINIFNLLTTVSKDFVLSLQFILSLNNMVSKTTNHKLQTINNK